MTERSAARALLAFLAVSAALPGVWATLSPQGFYDDFPAIGSWVSSLPPYNEHLTRDAGAFYLAFALLLGWAAYRPDRALIRPLMWAWMAFSALHFLFHVFNLEEFSTADAVLQTGTLAAVLLAPAAVLRWSR